MNQLMNSQYERIADDNYQTIDPRCVNALVEHIGFTLQKYHVIDPCAPSGSGIVTRLRELGFKANGTKSALSDEILGGFHVTNPPYTRGLVDEIMWHQINLVKARKIHGFAALMRWTFDHAVSRQEMFRRNPYYFGQIKTLFRPEWVKVEKKKQPFHPFIWHIWTVDAVGGCQSVMYSDGE